MFTGLIEKTGVLKSLGGGTVAIGVERQFDDLTRGDSIAVNGVCLTLERFDDNTLSFHTLDETLSRSGLAVLGVGAKVNLERAMSANGRFGGHFVTGHVDAASPVAEWRDVGADRELRVALPESGRPLVFEKGSVAVDGVSLTIVDVGEDFFSVHLIPETLSSTALRYRHVGDLVNLEFDVLAKCVKHQLAHINSSGEGATLDALRNAGWEDA